MSKSSAVRFVTCCPWAAVTTASSWTRFTLTRRTGSGGAAGGMPVCWARASPTSTASADTARNITAAGVFILDSWVLTEIVSSGGQRCWHWIFWKSARPCQSAKTENTGRRLRDSQTARSHRDRPESREPRRRPLRSGPPSVPVSRQFLRPAAGHSRDRTRGGCHGHHGRIPPPGAAGRHRAHRNPALHRFQLLLRSHPPQPSEQLLLPLFRRRPRRLRLLHQGQVPRDFGPGEATLVLEMAWIRISGESLSALPAFLGALPVLRGPRQGDELRIRGDQAADARK